MQGGVSLKAMMVKIIFFNISNIRKGQMIRTGINVKFDSFESQRGPEAENVNIF